MRPCRDSSVVGVIISKRVSRSGRLLSIGDRLHLLDVPQGMQQGEHGTSFVIRSRPGHRPSLLAGQSAADRSQLRESTLREPVSARSHSGTLALAPDGSKLAVLFPYFFALSFPLSIVILSLIHIYLSPTQKLGKFALAPTVPPTRVYSVNSGTSCVSSSKRTQSTVPNGWPTVRPRSAMGPPRAFTV